MTENLEFDTLRMDASGHADYGAGALIVCDRLVRIYSADGIEVQALQGLDLVELPLRLAGAGRHPRRSRALELLEVLEVAHCAGRRPDQMSGGEQQRTAIAVALANSPSVLLADEPTGELDSATAASVFGALRTANSVLGVTVLVVTHDPAVSGVVRRMVAIRDGRTSTETLRAQGPGESGLSHAVEYAVLDRAGRLQLPREMTEALGMRDRVRLEAEPDHIGVWPDRPADTPADPLPDTPADPLPDTPADPLPEISEISLDDAI